MSIEMKTFLQLMYSFAKQYIAWYETNIKTPREAEKANAV